MCVCGGEGVLIFFVWGGGLVFLLFFCVCLFLCVFFPPQKVHKAGFYFKFLKTSFLFKANISETRQQCKRRRDVM